MKIIYHCFGGSHSSVTAAAIHLGLLDENKLPTQSELMKIPYYDKTNNSDFGSIRFMGRDKNGDDIYVLGKKSFGERYSRILVGVARILGVEKELMVINCMPGVNWVMKIGGFTSRRLQLVLIGRPLVTQGTKWAYKYLVNLVAQTREMLRKDGG